MIIKGFVNRAKKAGQEGGPRTRAKQARPLTAEDLEKIRDTACIPRKTDRGMGAFLQRPTPRPEWTSPSSR